MTGEFGAFLRRMKVVKDFRLRPVAEKTGISLTYLSDILHGRRLPPDREKLELLAQALGVTEAERYEMYDAAARDRKEVPADLVDYIMDESLPSLRAALRLARDLGADDDFWKRIMEFKEKTYYD